MKKINLLIFVVGVLSLAGVISMLGGGDEAGGEGNMSPEQKEEINEMAEEMKVEAKRDALIEAARYFTTDLQNSRFRNSYSVEHCPADQTNVVEEEGGIWYVQSCSFVENVPGETIKMNWVIGMQEDGDDVVLVYEDYGLGG